MVPYERCYLILENGNEPRPLASWIFSLEFLSVGITYWLWAIVMAVCVSSIIGMDWHSAVLSFVFFSKYPP